MVRKFEQEGGHLANKQSQVLLKRKPVITIPPPTNIPDHAEVFVMRGTNEIFTDYEKYLKRFDYLNQKKFVDAVNGKSGLTYWDALASEQESSASIESVFPEPLRDPILRKVQFSTTGRMDELVNTTYDDFKHDFFPGEEVIVALGEGEPQQFTGIIREKAKFPMIRGADGSVQRAPFSRYFVRLNNPQAEEALLDDKHIRRDRKVFTKQNLRAFLKNSLQREAWTGAPWLVKEYLAIQYRLPMEIPAHLLQDAKLLHSRQQVFQPQRMPKNKKKGMTHDEWQRLQQQEMHMQQMQQQHPGAPHQPLMNYHRQQPVPRIDPRPPPPPPIKYPIEDLDLPPKRNGVTRPELKFFTNEMHEYIRKGRQAKPQEVEIESIGMLLEVWNTLNVQCEVFVLDSFTFDDFVDAMRYQSTDVPCELLDEVHCAVLKHFVDDKGQIQVKGLPKALEADTPMDDSEAQDESEVSTPIPDAPARSTRSRLSHIESAADVELPTERPNRAAEMLAQRSWVDRCAARDFADGGWQVIMAGILHQLTLSPFFRTRCAKILAHLAPMEEEPIVETARVQYATMDLNLRISALQILTILTIQTDAVKEFLETCSDDMTDVRKRKIEFQREKKEAMHDLQTKDRDRKILLPANMPASPTLESAEPEVTEDIAELNGVGSSEAEEDDALAGGRSLRRAGERKRKRAEDDARREKEAKERAEAAKAQNKQAKEFKKLCNEVEQLQKKVKHLEEEIAECDGDLREANVQRTKVLGKDRFCNRYYWFERNGQPFGGLPTSSTASYGYANGRIWVQGPDAMEREGFIERNKEEQAQYQAQFRMTVPERRQQEEGATILENAQEWGFYDDPDRLDNLIGWLEDRGERERKLKRELLEWRDKIVQYMEAHKKFKDDEAAKKIDVEEEQATRVNTRHKVQEDQSAAKERCLKWTNSMAINEIGHLHSQPPVPKKKQPKVAAREMKGLAIPVSRSKPTTRQGDRYDFSK